MRKSAVARVVSFPDKKFMDFHVHLLRSIAVMVWSRSDFGVASNRCYTYV